MKRSTGITISYLTVLASALSGSIIVNDMAKKYVDALNAGNDSSALLAMFAILGAGMWFMLTIINWIRNVFTVRT